MRKKVYIAPAESRPVPGWERYRVTAHGRAFGHYGELRVKIARGYRVVTLRDNGRSWTVKVARLVLEAFEGPAAGRLVRHLNDDKGDDRRSNLAYGTVSENAEDARRNGKLCEGQRHGRAVYSDSQIRAVRRLREEGRTYTAIAEETGVRRASVIQIATGRQWRSVANA